MPLPSPAMGVKACLLVLCIVVGTRAASQPPSTEQRLVRKLPGMDWLSVPGCRVGYMWGDDGGHQKLWEWQIAPEWVGDVRLSSTMGSSEFGSSPKSTDCYVSVYEVSGVSGSLPKCKAPHRMDHCDREPQAPQLKQSECHLLGFYDSHCWQKLPVVGFQGHQDSSCSNWRLEFGGRQEDSSQSSAFVTQCLTWYGDSFRSSTPLLASRCLEGWSFRGIPL